MNKKELSERDICSKFISPAVIQLYLHKLILSPYFQSLVLNRQTGAGRGGLPKNRMDLIPVALPPLAEQVRVVQKVGELIALCGRLEEQIRNTQTVRSRLLESILSRALNGDEALGDKLEASNG